MDKIEKTIVKINSCETKQMSNGGYMSKVGADDGKNYTVFHTKKDGGNTIAYDSLSKMPMSGINTMVEINYKENTFEKDGQTYTGRNALSFKPVVVTEPAPAVSTPPVQEINNNSEEVLDEGFLPVN